MNSLMVSGGIFKDPHGNQVSPNVKHTVLPPEPDPKEEQISFDDRHRFSQDNYYGNLEGWETHIFFLGYDESYLEKVLFGDHSRRSH